MRSSTVSSEERSRAVDVAGVVDAGAIRSLYQPIVDIDSREVVAYEALARGPEGSALELPDALFAAAETAGMAAELDWACAEAALRGALDARLGPEVALFVNLEAATLGTTPPQSLRDAVSRARDRIRVVVEITERAVAARPAELLGFVSVARSLGWGLAMDDVGVDPGSLALLPFVHPDVVKLDMDLVRSGHGRATAAVVAAVMAYGERSGALTLAEGIETDEHLRRAVAMGARLGQGWLFGRPLPLPADPGPVPGASILSMLDVSRLASQSQPEHGWAGTTPYEIVAAHRSTRVGPKRVLLDLSRHVEEHALAIPEHPVVVGAFQFAERFTPGTRRRYERLAAHCSLTAALGIGLDARSVAGVLGGSLRADDPLSDEWSVVVVGPQSAIALAARDLHSGDDGAGGDGGGGDDGDRLFDFAVTHDRELVVAAARSLLARIQPG